MSDETSEERAKKEEIYLALWSRFASAQQRGGLTDEERAEIAQRRGLSEALLVRYQRAGQAYGAAVGERVGEQARREALLNLKALGKKNYFGTKEYFEELSRVRLRLVAEAPEQDIIREYEAADDALRAALGLPSQWNLSPEDNTSVKGDP